MRSRRPLLLLVLSACAPVDASIAPGHDLPPVDDDGAAGTVDTDAALGASCDARIAWIAPEADAELVPVDTTITVGFEAALPEGAAWSLDVTGASGHAELAPDRLAATFTPDAPLSPDQAYDVHARACDDEETARFRTLGPPIDPSRLEGRTWRIALDDLTFVVPTQGSTVLPLLGVPDVLAHVEHQEDGPHLLLRLAFRAGSHVVPIPCAPAADAGRLDLTANPRFVTETTEIGVTWQDLDLVAEAFRVEGVVEDDGSRLVSLAFHGQFDVRPIEAITGLSGTCDQAADDGHPCEPCADGVVACLPTLVTDGRAEEVAPGDFDVDAADFFADLFGFCSP